IMYIVGPQGSYYEQLGIVDHRVGNRTPMNAPRNLYQTSDDRWLAISATGLNTPRRMMDLVGHPEIGEEPWFDSARGRAEHVDLLDDVVAAWIRGLTRAEAMKACEEIGAAVAPVYDAADILA